MTDHAVVIGAGYAGLTAANGLARAGFDVTIITPAAEFVERVRLHRVAAGLRESACHDLSAVLHPAVHMRVDAADRIDPDAHAVRLASGVDLAYDWLVVATGSDRVPDGDPRLHHIVNAAAARRLRQALADQPDEPVTVVGAGLTGVEAACALATAGREVEVVARDLPGDDPYHRALARRLHQLGITVRRGELEDVEPGHGIVVDTTGLAVSPLAAASGLPTDDRGRLLVDPDLRVPGHPEILGAGDAVHVTGQRAEHLRMSCATAQPMGAHAARVITRLAAGQEPAAFEHSYVIQCVDLGGKVGRVQFVTAHDAPRPFALTSFLGGLGKEIVVRSTVSALRRGARRPVLRTSRMPASQTSQAGARVS